MSQYDGPITDPHHHLWSGPSPLGEYLLDELRADMASGAHDVTKTVFIECGASYRTEGPEHLRVVGETEFVAEVADASEVARETTGTGPVIHGIIATTDLSLEPTILDEVLDAHTVAAGGRFRGIRDALASPPPEAAPHMMLATHTPAGKGSGEDFRRGVRRLGERGLTYDSWHFHPQIDEFTDLAAACPDTTMIHDHFGTPLGVGPFAGKHDTLFGPWQDSITALAKQPNVVAKLGGLAMPDNGFGWSADENPPSVDEFVAAQSRWYVHTIEAFGPERCMFESNFPVDKLSLPADTFWAAAKEIASSYSAAEQEALFHGTADRVYSL